MQVFVKNLLVFIVAFCCTAANHGYPRGGKRGVPMIRVENVVQQLREHVEALTITIGERSVRVPANLEKTADYIISFYRDLGLPVEAQPYQYREVSL